MRWNKLCNLCGQGGTVFLNDSILLLLNKLSGSRLDKTKIPTKKPKKSVIRFF